MSTINVAIGTGRITVALTNFASTVTFRRYRNRVGVGAGELAVGTASIVLPQTPKTNSLLWYRNGILQEEGATADYAVSGATLTLAVALEAGDKVEGYYATV